MIRNNQFYVGMAIVVVAGGLAALASTAWLKIALVVLLPALCIGFTMQIIGLGKLRKHMQETDKKWEELLKR